MNRTFLVLAGLAALIGVVGYQVVLVADDVAHKGGPEALAKCRAAAAKASEPTDFDCDWKTVIANAPGAALTGKYHFRETGLTGDMTVLEGGDGPALVGITVVSKDPNAHTCVASFTAARSSDDALVAKPADVEGCEVAIRSAAEPNIVTVTATDACRNHYCGMRAAFAGKWGLAH